MDANPEQQKIKNTTDLQEYLSAWASECLRDIHNTQIEAIAFIKGGEIQRAIAALEAVVYLRREFKIASGMLERIDVSPIHLLS